MNNMQSGNEGHESAIKGLNFFGVTRHGAKALVPIFAPISSRAGVA